MSETTTAFREGDIYNWVWADKGRAANSGAWGSYHCYSRRAVVKNGHLCDTFWSSEQKALRPEDVVLTHLGNIHEMATISPYARSYYRDEDVIDMRHSNNSRAPIYLKPGAARDGATMTEAAKARIEDERANILYAERRINELETVLAQIADGRLEDVHFILNRNDR